MISEERIKNLEKEIEEIKNRNVRVEADKAWEISYFRTILISLVLYSIITFSLYIIGVENFMFNGLIPVLGFIFSIQSFPFIKKWWIGNRHKKSK